MSEYTPTTEDVRAVFGDGYPVYKRQFDQWLNSTIRQAKAEALREAAGYLLNRTWPIDFFPGVAGSAHDLTFRASRIEAGE